MLRARATARARSMFSSPFKSRFIKPFWKQKHP